MSAITQASSQRSVRSVGVSHWLMLGLVVTGSIAWLVFASGLGDYGMDAGPAMNALVEGHLGRALALQPLMGSFSVLVRLPFALAAHAFGGSGEVPGYRAGIVPCFAAAGMCGAVIAGRRGVLDDSRGLITALLAVLTPASVSAVRLGHPEEALAAALTIGAILLADRRAVWAGVLLGLAIATKQWAVVAVPAFVWLVPANERRRALGASILVAAALTVPLILGDLSAFAKTTHNAATAPASTSPASIWYLASHRIAVGGGASVAVIPSWLARLTHPLILVVAPLLLLPLWRRRPTLADALALVALALLLRCVLDPVNNEYYHLPFILALLAYETTARRWLNRLPLATLFACAGLSVTFDLLWDRALLSHGAMSAVYLTWVAAMGAYLVHALRRTPA